MASELAPLDDGQWRRCSPAVILAQALPFASSMLREGGFVLLGTFGIPAPYGDLARLAFAIVMGWLFLGGTVFHYVTFRYRVFEGRLEIVSGLLFRQRRIIDPTRVQSSKTAQSFLNRIFGLVDLVIETAGGKKGQGELTSIAPAASNQVIAFLGRSAPQPADALATPQSEQVILRLGLRELVLYGVTGGGLGVFAVLLTALGRVFDTHDNPVAGRILHVLHEFQKSSHAPTWLLVGAGVLGGAWIFGVAGAVIRHHGFTLTRSGDSLRITRGLLTRVQHDLDISRVQHVEIAESWLRRWLGYGHVEVHTAGTGKGEGHERSEVTIPMVPRARLREIAKLFQPAVEVLETASLERPHPAALRRSIVGGFLESAVPVAIFLVAMHRWRPTPWSWLALAWIPAKIGASVFDFKNQFWFVDEGFVAARRGFFVRTTQLVMRRKLQSVMLFTGPLLRYRHLASTQLQVAGASVVLPLISETTAVALREKLIHRLRAS